MTTSIHTQKKRTKFAVELVSQQLLVRIQDIPVNNLRHIIYLPARAGKSPILLRVSTWAVTIALLAAYNIEIKKIFENKKKIRSVKIFFEFTLIYLYT